MRGWSMRWLGRPEHGMKCLPHVGTFGGLRIDWYGLLNWRWRPFGGRTVQRGPFLVTRVDA